MEQIALREENAEELKRVVALPVADLTKAVELLQKEHYVRSPEKLEVILRRIFRPDVVGSIVSFGISFAALADQRGVDVAVVLDATERALRKSGWSDEELELFSSRKSLLCEISSTRAFFLGSKVSSLFRAAGNHVHEVRSIVDVRPVFNSAKSRIETLAVFTNLCFTVSDGHEEERNLQIALDFEDLLRVRDVCQSALDKIKIIEDTLVSGTISDVIVYGRGSNAE
jgi:hypothetical protein